MKKNSEMEKQEENLEPLFFTFLNFDLFFRLINYYHQLCGGIGLSLPGLFFAGVIYSNSGKSSDVSGIENVMESRVSAGEIN